MERRWPIHFPVEWPVRRDKFRRALHYLFTDAYFHLQNVFPHRIWLYHTVVPDHKTKTAHWSPLCGSLQTYRELHSQAARPHYCQWTVKKPLSLQSPFQLYLRDNHRYRGETLQMLLLLSLWTMTNWDLTVLLQ